MSRIGRFGQTGGKKVFEGVWFGVMVRCLCCFHARGADTSGAQGSTVGKP